MTEPGDEHREPKIDDRGHPLAQMIAIGVIASIIGVAISLAIDWFPDQGATSSDDIDTLYDVLLIASVPIFVLVMTIAIYCVIRFRAKPGDMSDGEPIHGNTRLEIFWVTVPFIMVTALAIYGWIVLNDIEAKEPNELQVNVVGQQFTWHFEYPDEKVKSNQLVLPVDRPVHFRIKTEDVIHSFWVPQFRLKSDAVPGITTRLRLTPDKVGDYEVVCAELCGLGHAAMRNAVRVVEPAVFDDWVAKQRQPAGGGASGGGGGGADGKQLFVSEGCGSCHILGDAGSNGDVGPELDDLAANAAKIGKAEGQSAQEYVRTSIEDPGAYTVKGFPEGVMPDTYKDDLSPEEIDALVEYLLEVSSK